MLPAVCRRERPHACAAVESQAREVEDDLDAHRRWSFVCRTRCRSSRHRPALVCSPPDGTIEAIEDPARPFVLAFQWHAGTLAYGPSHWALFYELVAVAA